MQIQTDLIEKKIIKLREKRVVLDRDLATLYGVETKKLKQAVRRNIGRELPRQFTVRIRCDNSLLRNNFRFKKIVLLIVFLEILCLLGIKKNILFGGHKMGPPILVMGNDGGIDHLHLQNMVFGCLQMCGNLLKYWQGVYSDSEVFCSDEKNGDECGCISSRIETDQGAPMRARRTYPANLFGNRNDASGREEYQRKIGFRTTE